MIQCLANMVTIPGKDYPLPLLSPMIPCIAQVPIDATGASIMFRVSSAFQPTIHPMPLTIPVTFEAIAAPATIVHGLRDIRLRITMLHGTKAEESFEVNGPPPCVSASLPNHHFILEFITNKTKQSTSNVLNNGSPRP